MGELGKCVVCGGNASVLYPLLHGEPAFCSSHHNQQDAGKYGCDLSPSDNGQWDDWFDLDEEVTYNRDDFIWTDKEGNQHRLKDIDDYYLQNIINFLKRKEEPKYRLITFLKKEQEIRKQEAAK